MENGCGVCGSTKIMNNLSVVDKGDAGAKHELAIESFSNPGLATKK